MSVADKITRLTTARDSIRTAINDKGGSASNHGFEDFATDITNLPSGGGGIPDRVAAALQTMIERKCYYFETFAYDNETHGVIDLAALDDTPYAIKNIGQRTFNSFGVSDYTIRIIMPKNLESISGANWHGAARVKYYDFSGFQGATPPVYSSTTTTLGNSAAIILVPNSLIDAWKSATGWASFAGQIVGVDEVYN